MMNYKKKDFVDNLVKEHSIMLVRFLTRRMKSCEDIAQAIFMRLYTHWFSAVPEQNRFREDVQPC